MSSSRPGGSSQTFTEQSNVQVLRLTAKNSEQEQKTARVQWEEGTLDNEFLNKKSSKRCCIFHKQRKFGEDSSDEDSSSSSSDDEKKKKNNDNDSDKLSPSSPSSSSIPVPRMVAGVLIQPRSSKKDRQKAKLAKSAPGFVPNPVHCEHCKYLAALEAKSRERNQSSTSSSSIATTIPTTTTSSAVTTTLNSASSFADAPCHHHTCDHCDSAVKG